METTGKLIQGDNLKVMQELIEEGKENTINLIYIDPPFFSGDDYYTSGSIGDGKEDFAYSDTWNNEISSYLNMLKPRLKLMHKLLASTGSIFLHIDWHAGHYVKILLDEVFGMGNLRNEIIWHYGGPSPVKTSFPRKHDTIFFYTKSSTHTFKPQYEPFKDYLLRRAKNDQGGRLWVDQNVGKITKRKLDELTSEGRIFRTKTGRNRRKQFLDEMKGDMVDSVWEIPIINSQSNERTGYPTQKPIALLDRIIACASNENDIIADFFCGSGTALVSAQRAGRQWIGVDISPVAISISRERLSKLHDDESIGKNTSNIRERTASDL